MNSFRKIISTLVLMMFLFNTTTVPFMENFQMSYANKNSSLPVQQKKKKEVVVEEKIPDIVNQKMPEDVNPYLEDKPNENTQNIEKILDLQSAPVSPMRANSENNKSKPKKRFIVKYKDEGKKDASKQRVGARVATPLCSPQMQTKKVLRKNKAEVLEVDEESSAKVIEELKKDVNVEYVQPDYELKSLLIPTEPKFGDQWALNNVGQTINNQKGVSGFDISATAVWDATLGDENVIVGVLDTGIDINSLDLSANIYANPKEIPGNGIDDDKNGYIDDINGYDFYNDDNTVYDGSNKEIHGTHIAGIIAGRMNNFGVTGVAPNVKILPLKFIDGTSGYTSDAIEAINYAESMGVKIINSSFGGYENNPALKEAMTNSSMLFICAAGNDGSTNKIYPASYGLPNTISVGAHDNKGNYATFSNYGMNVDIAAPGVGILSSIPENKLATLSGTSMAAPFVTGAAALVMSIKQEWTAGTVKLDILNTAKELSSLNGKVKTGGILNVASACGIINSNETVPESNEPINVTPSTSGSYKEPEDYKNIFKWMWVTKKDGKGIAKFTLLEKAKEYDSLKIRIQEKNKRADLFNKQVNIKSMSFEIPGIVQQKNYLFEVGFKKGEDIVKYTGVMIFQPNKKQATIRAVEPSTNAIRPNIYSVSRDDKPGAVKPQNIKYEVESNNTLETAQQIYHDDDNYGKIQSIGDVDWFKVKFTNAGSANFWLGEIPLGKDYDLYLHNSAGTQLRLSAQGGNADELISGYPINANEWYYIKVVGFGTASDTTAYYKLRTRNTNTNLPDLVITEVSWSPANPIQGSPVSFTVKVKNQGSVTTSQYTGVLFHINNVPVSWASTEARLGAGQSVTINAQGGTWTPSTAGTYTLKSLVDDVRYMDELSENNNENINTINVTGIQQDTQAPTAPSNLRSTMVTTNRIDLSWDASTDNVAVTGYEVYRGSTLIATTTFRFYTDNNLSQNTTYSYYVRAKDYAGNRSANSNTISTTTNADTPSGDSYESNDTVASAKTINANGTITATIHTATDVDYYKFVLGSEMSTTVTLTSPSGKDYDAYVYDSTGTAEKSDLRLTSSVSPESKTAVLSAGTYYIKVYGYGGANSTSTYSLQIASVATADTQAPTTPGTLRATTLSADGATLSWNASTDNVGVTGYEVYRNGTLRATTTSTSYSDSGLTASTTYSYYVRAKDAAGNRSGNSNTINVTTASNQTDDYGNETSTAHSISAGNSINGNIDYAGDVDFFRFTASATGSYTISTTSSLDTYGHLLNSSGTEIAINDDNGDGNNFQIVHSLTSGQVYYVKVRHYNSTGMGAYTLLVTAPSNIDTQAPTAPTSLRLKARSKSTLVLIWNASADNVGVSGYEVYRGSTYLATVTGLTYRNTGLSANTLYSYTVKAKDAAGNKSLASNTLRARTYADGYEYNNTVARAKTVGINRNIYANIHASTDIDYYKFVLSSQMRTTVKLTSPTGKNYDARVYTSNGTTEVTALRLISTTSPEAKATNLSAGTYYIRVNGVSGASTMSNYALRLTATALDTQAPSVPGNLRSTAVTTNSIALAWNASIDNVRVTGYEVYRNGRLRARTTSTSYTDSAVSANTAYTYVVKAKDAAGNKSGNSNTISVTTDDYGNAAASAYTVAAGSQYNGSIGIADDSDWFKFTSPANAYYEFATTGETDTYGEIYSSSNVLLNSDDNSNGNGNFRLVLSLPVNTTVYVKVRHTTSSGTGNYGFAVKEDLDYLGEDDLYVDDFIIESGATQNGNVFSIVVDGNTKSTSVKLKRCNDKDVINVREFWDGLQISSIITSRLVALENYYSGGVVVCAAEISNAVYQSRGQNVRNIQNALKKAGCWIDKNGNVSSASATGFYGETTKASVIKYQLEVMKLSLNDIFYSGKVPSYADRFKDPLNGHVGVGPRTAESLANLMNNAEGNELIDSSNVYRTPVILIHGRGDNSFPCFGVINGYLNVDRETGDEIRRTANDNNNYEDPYKYKYPHYSVNGYSSLDKQKIVTNGFATYETGDPESPYNMGYGLLNTEYYEPNRNLFVFNYANQDVVYKNAKLLEMYIQNLVQAAKVRYKNNPNDRALLGALFRTWDDYYNNNYTINLIGHSMGGLVSRYYIENLKDEQNRSNSVHVNKLITINTPHWGSRLADLGVYVDRLPCDGDLQPDSRMYGGTETTMGISTIYGPYKYPLSSTLRYSNHGSTKYYAIVGLDFQSSAINKGNQIVEMPTNYSTYQQVQNFINSNLYENYWSPVEGTVKIYPDIGQLGDNVVNLLSQIGWSFVEYNENSSPYKRINFEKIYLNLDTNGGNSLKNHLHSKNQHRLEVINTVNKILGL